METSRQDGRWQGHNPEVEERNMQHSISHSPERSLMGRLLPLVHRCRARAGIQTASHHPILLRALKPTLLALQEQMPEH